MMDFEACIAGDAGDEVEWSERNDFWIGESNRSPNPRLKRRRNTHPLILTGNGTSLRIEDGTLVIREGFTHYPQDRAAQRFFKGSNDIPSRIILLDGSGTLSFDVLTWLSEQDTPLIRIRWTGEIVTVGGNGGYCADRERVRWQTMARSDQSLRLAFSKELIGRKLANAIDTLRDHLPPSRSKELALAKTSQGLDRIAAREANSVEAVRAIEGDCAASYFSAWRHLTVGWKASRHPIPDEWRTYTSRSSMANGTKPKNRNASHPINAMLNYAYTVKLAHLQIRAIADGYDPTIGVMHHDGREKPAFIFDLIEPERPKVDAAILAFVQSQTFSGADFLIQSDGVCRLAPQLAKRIALLASA